ncbi:M64 family metallopeptidase [Flavivirga eckloniae]|uniref:Fibronectin type-III domain-containing protein n=1 Tax=Flavivirga eckloniae TaxID=1803846 RepID=A0A2K9PTU0_9FLAO|nr:M64 family metallopeptidase [Flavivirga eckloniae]AUP80459.1 hypothetical protein C1H87_17760 [Flavivirga eckloniae]
MKKQFLHIILFILPILIGFQVVNAQTFPHVYIMQNGSPSSKINIVFVGDGYRPSQMNKYISDVTATTREMFKIEPFKSLKNSFNVIAIKVPSNAEGAADSPNYLIDNYFGSTFNYGGIQRLLVATRSGRISSVINNSFPQSDQGIVIVNDSRYGGSGGHYAALSTHSSAPDLCVHELGHSYADLADEYWYRAQEKANQTADGNSSTNRWRKFIGREQVGIYRYESPGSNYYRPHQNCKMRYLSANFCLVCRSHIRKVTDGLVDVGQGPATPTSLKPKNIKETSFEITWSKVSDATSYDVQLWDEEGDTWVDKGSTSKNSFSFSGLTANGTEYTRVRATNADGSSSWTNHITVKLDNTNSGPPSEPTDLDSYNVNSTYFGIHWTTVDDATSYDIQLWNESKDRWENHGNTNSYYYYLYDLPSGSTQYVRIRSKNENGVSSYTDYITITLIASKASAYKKKVNLPSLEETKSEFILFPNPMTRELHIQGLASQDTGIVSIFSISGELILEEKFETKKLTIDVSTLKTGTYMVVIKHNNGSTITRKLIKE